MKKEKIDESGRSFDLVLIVCVDDILFAGRERWTKHFQEEIKREFKVKSKSVAEEFIGISLKQNVEKHTVHLHQAKTIQKAIERFGMQTR